MNKVLRDYCIDAVLFLLLGIEVAAAIRMPHGAPGHQLNASWHVHALVGAVLATASFVHTALHSGWIKAVITGKIRRPVKLAMDSMVAIMLLVAVVSGHAAMTSAAAASLHRISGIWALVGLTVHAVKHTPWMAKVTRRFVEGKAAAQANAVAALRSDAR